MVTKAEYKGYAKGITLSDRVWFAGRADRAGAGGRDSEGRHADVEEHVLVMRMSMYLDVIHIAIV
eukprot:COSAG06_NODE_32835_length_499_cov_1.107500_1_plen_65_part_00